MYISFARKQWEVAQYRCNLRHGAHIIVADRNGTILFSTNPKDATGQKAGWRDAEKNPSETPHTGTFRHADGTLWFTASASAGTAGDPQALTIRYEYPAEPLLSIINRGFWIDLAAILLLFMIALVIGWVAVQAVIGRNIKLLIGATKQLRRHNFSTRIADKVSGHEFTEIANHFDEMAEENKFREEQWETAVRRQTKQNAILRRPVDRKRKRQTS